MKHVKSGSIERSELGQPLSVVILGDPLTCRSPLSVSPQPPVPSMSPTSRSPRLGRSSSSVSRGISCGISCLGRPVKISHLSALCASPFLSPSLPLFFPSLFVPLLSLSVWAPLSLDDRTAQKMLWISEGATKVSRMSDDVCPYLDRPERYDHSPQVGPSPAQPVALSSPPV